MAKNKGHENLIPCKKGESGNPNGRPKKLVSKVLDELKLEGELVSKTQISEIYMVMLSLTMERLTEIANDKKISAVYRLTAKAILAKEGFKNLETMADRSHGKAMITQEIKQENTQKEFDLSKLTDGELRKYLELANKCATDTGGDSEA